SSLDESVAGETTAMLPFRRVPDELKGSLWQRAMDNVIPSAYAAACWEPVFGACNAGVRVKDFAGCTVGPATVTGTVTLTFSRTLCLVAPTAHAATRIASLALPALWGGSVTVTSRGGGQTLTKTDAGFDYTVGGMERVLTLPSGRKLFDVATHTTAPIVVTGSSRADVKIVSGSLQIDHRIADYSVTLSASNLAWTSNCN